MQQSAIKEPIAKPIEIEQKEERVVEPVVEKKEEKKEEPLPEHYGLYRAASGDRIDEIIADIINRHKVQIPIVRIIEGKYMIGNDSKNVMIKGSKAMVRIGGGFEELESYILGHQDDELA